MGDRANIKTSDGIHFYTHWDGSVLPNILADALERGRDRWDDYIYLNRIIFSEMIKNDIENLTGYGISTNVGDGGDRILELTDDTVIIKDREWTFEEFIKERPKWRG